MGAVLSLAHDIPPPVDETGASGQELLRRMIAADDPAMADLDRYRELIVARSHQANLVGPSVLADFWLRHALDCAQLLQLAPTARTWVDLGSGAGFPGVVIAILLKRHGDGRVHLIESVGKKARFLSEVVAALDLPAEVHCERAEHWRPPARVDIVAARACAPLSGLLAYALPGLHAGGRALFLKGRTIEAELAQARTSWRFQSRLHPSLSDPGGRIVEIWGAARV